MGCYLGLDEEMGGNALGLKRRLPRLASAVNKSDDRAGRADDEMRQTKVDKFIAGYCQEKNIKLLIDPDLHKDDGLSYPPYREVHLAETYSSQKIKLAVFLHEASHVIVDRFKNKPYNIFECEFWAWDRAMKMHRKYFGRSFSKAQAEFMLKCLKTYCRSQYEFAKSKDATASGTASDGAV